MQGHNPTVWRYLLAVGAIWFKGTYATLKHVPAAPSFSALKCHDVPTAYDCNCLFPYLLLIIMAYQPYQSIASSSNTPTLNNDASNPPSGHVLSKDEWEDIKPLIYRLYIEEDKTFLRIKPFITEIHGRAPTRNQFDKRVQRWGFRKNVPRADRDVLSHGSASGSQNITGKGNKQGNPRRRVKEFETQASKPAQPGITFGKFGLQVCFATGC